MKPNIFVFSPDCPEDFFSRSLAYISNLFPDIGQRFVERIGVLAGKKADYFGDFQSCEFVGHSRPDNHTASRPDLTILCTKGTIYFENKLESPLSFDQMQRHASFTCRDQNCSLVFVSNIYHENASLKSLPGYLHPAGSDHYLWVDVLSVFENTYAHDSLASKMLTDFSVALKENGMIGRNLRGASGSLYTLNSDAVALAFTQLWDVLKQLGFKLSKKPEREGTLRAYPVKHRQYPLLNPRFIPTAAGLDPAWDKECLDLTVVSKGDRTILDRQLAQFDSTKECAFFSDTFYGNGGYNYHGNFILPLRFRGSAINSEIDFRALEQPLRKVLHFCAGLRGSSDSDAPQVVVA
jgi:hypothetical protein